jgi:dihydrofolate reductase
MKVKCILAAQSMLVNNEEVFGIGYKNMIPWKCKADMQFFKNKTSKVPDGKVNFLIMGRNTYESMRKVKLGSKRVKVVVTTNASLPIETGDIKVVSIEEGLQLASLISNIHNVYIIGGKSIYEKAFIMKECKTVYLNILLPNKEVPCDVFVDIAALDTYEKKKTSKVIDETNDSIIVVHMEKYVK